MEVYPEHEKLESRRQEYEHVTWFLEWLESNGYSIEHTRKWFVRNDEIVGSYFDIDMKQLRKEYKQILRDILTATKPENRGKP